MNVKQERLLARLVQFLDSKGSTFTTPTEMARGLGVPPQAVEAMLTLGVSRAEIVSLGGGFYASGGQLREIFEGLRGQAPAGGVETAFFRTQTGLSRSQADLLLAHLERKEWVESVDGRWQFIEKLTG